MPYLGNEPAAAFTSTTKDTFSGDASTTDFTMSKSANVNAVRVVVENVVQNPTVAYTCSGTTLSFTSAPPTGTNNIYVVHLGPPAATIAPPTVIGNETTFTGNAIMKNSNPDANGAKLTFFKDSESPADSDTVGLIDFNTNNSSGTELVSTRISSVVDDVTAGTEDSHMAFSTRSAGTLEEVLSIHRYGIKMGQGNGIDFHDYSTGTNISSNFLDDYEEGSFTPTYAPDSGTITTTSNAGKYVKIGDLVHCHFRIRSTGVSGIGGAIGIAGFPFTPVSDARSSGSKWFARNWGADMPNFSFGVPAGTTTANLYKQAMNSGASSVNSGDFSTGGDDNVLEASITYQVA